MDDDEREKLIEYLRNNRPESKINLGNNPYENLNYRLDDSNSDKNLNLDNSKISNNQTKSKRDYDKNPFFFRDRLNSYKSLSFFRVIIYLLLKISNYRKDVYFEFEDFDIYMYDNIIEKNLKI